MEFPRLVYKSQSNHTLVNDSNDYDSHIKDGWFSTVPEALAGEADIPTGEATRDELVQKAKELGLKFGGNTKPEKIEAMINEALNGVD